MSARAAVTVELPVGYHVQGRAGRRTVDATVSDTVAFGLDVTDAADAPVTYRIERPLPRLDRLDHDRLHDRGDGDTPVQILEVRTCDGVLLRPLTAPGGTATVGVDGLRHAVAEIAERSKLAITAARHASGVRWPGHPTASPTCPRPWAVPDRVTLGITRATFDGRAEALAEAALAMSGARLIDGTVWVRCGAPLLCHDAGGTGSIHRTERVLLPGHDLVA